jgi:hypothetical protein
MKQRASFRFAEKKEAETDFNAFDAAANDFDFRIKDSQCRAEA